MKRFLNLTQIQLTILALTCVAVFALVYAPHLNYRFPFHIDEWHHISESIRLGNYGEYFNVLRQEDTQRFSGMEIGFHAILFTASFIVDLVSVYRFFPALWAMVDALVIFFVAFKLFDRHFWTAWFAVVCFAAIKSNVNITGIWFFTPLSFAIPLIYLYLYCLHVGFEQENFRYILGALGLMVTLMPIHSISVLFAVPALLLYAGLHWRFVARSWRVFIWFIIPPLIGLVFYKMVLQLPWGVVVGHLFVQLQFRYGWGVLELQNSLLDLYPWIGFAAAVVGIVMIVLRGQLKRFSLFLLLPLAVIASMAIYRITGVSFLSPYQRNVYYLVLLLPLLSAYGFGAVFYHLRRTVETGLSPMKHLYHGAVHIPLLATVTIAFLAVGLLFQYYYIIPRRIDLYHVIEEPEYTALKYLAVLRPHRVMADPLMSMAVYPITRGEPVGAVAFYGNMQLAAQFTAARSCEERGRFLAASRADYIVSHDFFNCDPTLLYSKDYVYVYRVQ